MISKSSEVGIYVYVITGVGVTIGVGDNVGVIVGVGTSVGVTIGVGTSVGVIVGVGVSLCVGVIVGVNVNLGVGVLIFGSSSVTGPDGVIPGFRLPPGSNLMKNRIKTITRATIAIITVATATPVSTLILSCSSGLFMNLVLPTCRYLSSMCKLLDNIIPIDTAFHH